MRSRKVLTMCVAVATAAGLLSAAPGADASRRAPTIAVRRGITQPVFSYADAIRETVYVQSSIDGDLDGDLDLLATDIIRPRDTADGLKVPVIYEMSPYYQTSGRGNESEVKQEEDGDFVPERFPLFYDNYFVPRGYAVVLQDMPGTRNSEGCMVLGGPAEPLAAKATIDWLNGRGKAFSASGEEVTASWSTGRVGMIGKSYDGTVANAAAATGVRGLETIVPIGAISRWYDYHLNNGVQYLNAYLTPALFSFFIDQPPGDDEERGLDWVRATFAESTTCSAVGGYIVGRAANPLADYDDFWDERDYLRHVRRVRASVFLVHGLNDFNVKPNNFFHWWNALAELDVPRKIWLAQVGHVEPFDFRRAVWVRTLHRWFDRWLHGIDNGIMREPMVDLERRPGRWVRYGSWPSRRARSVTLFLGRRDRKRPGTLRKTSYRKVRTQTFTDDPFNDERNMASQPFKRKKTRLIFLSKPLARPVRLSGEVGLLLKATVDRADTNFTALLVDYGPARRVRHFDNGGVTTTERQTCWGQSTDVDDACYFEVKELTGKQPYEIVSRGWLDARHRETLRKNDPLVPGQAYRFAWSVFGEDYVFGRGHRIGIVIAGSDETYTVPDPNHATITLNLTKSSVTMPIVGGMKALRF